MTDPALANLDMTADPQSLAETATELDPVTAIRQRLEVARELPELVDNSNSAAVRWVADVTILLKTIDELEEERMRWQARAEGW